MPRCGSICARELYSVFPLPGVARGGESYLVPPRSGAGRGQNLLGGRVKGEVASSWKEFSSLAEDSYCSCLPSLNPPLTWNLLTQSTDSNKNSTKGNIIVAVVGDGMMVNFICQLDGPPRYLAQHHSADVCGSLGRRLTLNL